MIKKIKENIWQITFNLFGSCVYIMKNEGRIIVIDTGARWNREELEEDLEKLKINPAEVDVVLLTHNHFDHTGNINLFENAKVYGSYADFDCKGLNGPFMKKFKEIKEAKPDKSKKKIIPLSELKIEGIKTIKTPGHTEGSVCYYMPKEKILFSGDTIFHNGGIGRTDFPNSSREKMEDSLKELEKIDYEILCPGHV